MHGTNSLSAADTGPAIDASTAVDHAYRVHGPDVFRVALRFGRGDRAWAEDMTHEVFLALYDDWAAVNDPERVAGWLYRATVRRSLNRLRRQRLWQRPLIRRVAASWGAAAPDPETLSLGREQLDQLFRRVATLPDKQRVAFCMRHFDERPGKEIATLMGHSEGYVSKLLARAEAAVHMARTEEQSR